MSLFNNVRNKIITVTRKKPAILGIPKTNKQIHSYSLKKSTLKKRRKNKKK